MTERGSSSLNRSPTHLSIGPSSIQREGDQLVIDIDEYTVPLPRRLRGRIRVHLDQLSEQPFTLDSHGRHTWQPIAPRCEVEVSFKEPNLRWQGRGYLDSNRGSEPLEHGFRNWWWSRTHHQDGTFVQYETEARDGQVRRFAVHFDEATAQGLAREPLGDTQRLPRTGWGIERPVRGIGEKVNLVRTLEDTPFYSRSVINTTGAEGSAIGVHECLKLDRFASPAVQWMLPFRMPRRTKKSVS